MFKFGNFMGFEVVVAPKIIGKMVGAPWDGGPLAV